MCNIEQFGQECGGRIGAEATVIFYEDIRIFAKLPDYRF
jgi:hypothetical protein